VPTSVVAGMPLGTLASKDLDRPRRWLRQLKRDAIGLDVTYPLASGGSARRIYLDSTASTLRLRVVQDVLDRYQSHYANTHSTLHYAARLSTHEYQWAHAMVLQFTEADPEHWTCFFVGSGATGGINRIARTLRALRPAHEVVITSAMEHHSNDLPHRKHFPNVIHVPAERTRQSLGIVDIEHMARVLQAHEGRVNYVAITGTSNVTGIINPVHEIAALAHRYGALVVVDAAQTAAHLPIKVSGHDDPAKNLDVVAFSGHKVYAPGSPGVVVARKYLLAGVEPDEMGGGMVDTVWEDRYSISQRFPDREEAGTPNIPGAIGLAAALYALRKIGMDRIAEEETLLVNYALKRLSEVPGIIIYGETNPALAPRVGALSFNMAGCDHAFCAAVLNDYFNIAVRNECFCAHPYVRDMVAISLESIAESTSNEELESLAALHRGMVRASFGIYNTTADVDSLVAALKEIGTRRDELLALYERSPNGEYRHRKFLFDTTAAFSARSAVDSFLGD
jgi:cysteine desulfurase / selenocysteine lyase